MHAVVHPAAVRPFVVSLLFGAIGCASAHHHTMSPAGDVHTLRIHYNNAHALVATGGVILVDAGLEGDAETLLTELADHGIAPERIRAVVITHGHADHAGGAAMIRMRTGATLVAGRGDRQLITRGLNDQLCPTDDRARDDLDTHQAATYAGFEADRWIERTTSFGEPWGLDAQLVPIPGHTDGSLVLIAGEIAFVGDLFRGGIVGGSAETHFYMCDLQDNLRDIEALLEGYPNVRTYFTGHFGPAERSAVLTYVADRRAEMADGEP